MRVYFEDPDFTAVLKDSNGNILAEGTATVSRENKCIDFKSDFVPLYPLGTPLELDRFFEGEKIHQFMGEVYISNKKRLRLVNVTGQPLPGSENVYCFDVALPVTLKEIVVQEEIKKFGLFRKKTVENEPMVYPAMVNMLSGKRFEFSSPEMFEEGKRFFMSVNGPIVLQNIPVCVRKVYAFSGDVAHLCEFEELEPCVQEQLMEFIRKLNEDNNSF